MSPVPRGYSLQRVSVAGKLNGLSLPTRRDVKATPYIAASANDDKTLRTDTVDRTGDIGIDLKWGVRSDLTLDHVTPRHRGGPHTWENLTTACRTCNHGKGGRTPEEADMKLAKRPWRPSSHPAEVFAVYLERYNEWAPFIAGWRRREEPSIAVGS